MPPGSSRGIAGSGPGVPYASAVGEGGERVAQALVARPAELRVLALAGLLGDGGLPVGGDRIAVRIPGATIADLCQQRRGADHRVAAAEEAAEDLPIGMGVKRLRDL